MSAWKEWKVTGSKESLKEYERECNQDERDYWEELEEAEARRESEEFEEYQEIIFLKNWKDDVVKSLAKYDANSVEEVYQKGKTDAFLKIIEKCEQNSYTCHSYEMAKQLREQLKEQKNE